MNEQVIAEIKQLCGEVRILDNGWCLFVYRHLHFVYIPDDRNDMIRISIPHVANSFDYTRDAQQNVVNETNMEMKFVKVVLLNNGSISLNYDHKATDRDIISTLVHHMVTVLYMAFGFLEKKLENYEKKSNSMVTFNDLPS